MDLRARLEVIGDFLSKLLRSLGPGGTNGDNVADSGGRIGVTLR